MIRRCVIISMFVCAAVARSQSLRSPEVALPDAPAPILSGEAASPAWQNCALMAFQQTNGTTQPSQTPGQQSPEPADDGPDVTMFPHSKTARYWISGQTNTIFQAKPGFHSPYQGPNSFDNAPEYKTSLVETLFLGYQPHRNLRYNTDLLIDFESAGGRGLGRALQKYAAWQRESGGRCSQGVAIPQRTRLARHWRRAGIRVCSRATFHDIVRRRTFCSCN